MKKTKLSTLLALAVVLIGFASCDTDGELSIPLFSEITDLATFQGNMDSDIVVINAQGGPEPELDDETMRQLIIHTQSSSALFVNVHQVQTKNPELFMSTDITFDQAKEYDEQSVLNLKEVVDYFKNQENKKVYILGASFGAFIAQELIADYGSDVADGYLLLVGRLDIDEVTWQNFSQGKYAQYQYTENGDYSINLSNETSTIVMERNMARLAAGLGYNRYTEKLANITDLSNVTYVYGNRDEEVGPMSAGEVQFLMEKGAEVVLIAGEGHNNSAVFGITNLMKQAFGIE